MATATGALFLPKLAQFSKASVAVGVGLTALANFSNEFNVMILAISFLIGRVILMIVLGEIDKRTPPTATTQSEKQWAREG